MLNSKKLNPIVTGLFIKGRKLNISFIFVTQFYFPVPKDIRQNSAHYSIIKIPNLKENINKLHLIIHQILIFKTLRIFIKSVPKKPYSFLAIETTLASDNPLRFKKDLL